MEQLRWDRLQTLFSEAVGLSTAERDAFVLRETQEDPELRNELLELLQFDAGASQGAITQALGSAIDATSREQREALLGKIIDNYRLISVLGHGGTGTVYLAEGSDHPSAKVAIKLVHSAMVHGALGARFRAERQILASLDHPHIARLLDAGESADNRPYIVVEYVDGEPLDYYADQQTLTLRDRLQLFLDVCSAVQYAHQNLVVHRDLKPANILVTHEGTPKLLDFGIAKLLDGGGDVSPAPALTRLNDRLLTPEYASPEQILGQPVTTASDVYALGVLLYELLTGLRPYPVAGSVSQVELENLIRVADPERPACAVRRLASPGESAQSAEMAALAQARGLTPEQLHKRLQGDLDAIVMRALRKEPQHRYASVEQFAADIRRHLDNEPVRARQGNWAYYSQRFIRRHAFGVGIGVAFVAIGLAFMIAMWIQTKRIAAERDRATQESVRAEAVSDFMLEVFSASDPFTSQGRETTARELLDAAAKRIQSDLTQQPEVRARLLEAMGKSYRHQNQLTQAREMLGAALRLREHLPDPDALKTAGVLLELGLVEAYAGDSSAARNRLQNAVKLIQRRRAEHSLTYAETLRNLGLVEQQNGNVVAARKYFETSLSLYREFLGPSHVSIAHVLLNLEAVAHWSDDLSAAEGLVREASKIYKRTVPELNPDRVYAEARLAEILLTEGRSREAAAILGRVMERHKRLFGEKSRQVALTYMLLADAKVADGILNDAEEYSRKSLGIYSRSIGEEHYQTAFARTSLAVILMKKGELQEAKSLLSHSLDTFSKTLSPDHQYIASSEYFLGEVLLRQGHLANAETTLTASMNRWKRTEAPAWRASRSQSALGEVLYRQGKYKEAEQCLLESYQALASDAKADRDARVLAHERLVNFYQQRGQLEKLHALQPPQINDLRASR